MEGVQESADTQTRHLEPTAALKTAIGRYHHQLMEGCGRVCCSNANCASSGQLAKLNSNEAAARAITCLRDKAPLCDPLPEQEESLNESRVRELLSECRQSGDWVPMRRFVEHVFSTRDVLLRSFVTPTFRNRMLSGCDESGTEKNECNENQPSASRKRTLDQHQHCTRSISGPGKAHEENAVTTRREACTQPTSLSTHNYTPLRSSGLTRCTSDPSTTAAQPNAQCSDCGCRSVKKDASTDKTLASSTNQMHTKATELSIDESNQSVLTDLKNGKSPTDMDAARQCFDILFEDSSDHKNYLQVTMGAVALLCNVIDFQLQYERAWERNPCGMVHMVNVLFQLPFVQWFEFIDVGLTPLCKMCSNLGREGQMAVASLWANMHPQWMQDRVGMLQQAMTIRILTVIDAVGSLPRFTDRIEPLPTVVQTLSILYKAVLINAQRNTHRELPPELLCLARRDTSQHSDAPMDTDHNSSITQEDDQQSNRVSAFLSALQTGESTREEEEEERLTQMTEIDAWAVASTCFPLTEFLNSTLSENFSVEDDFVAYKSSQNGHAFSVMPEYSFVLSLQAKQRFLIICNRNRQRSERRSAIVDTITYGMIREPYLRLTVRRDNVVRDALDGLSAVAFDDVGSFRKQLRVYFDGEQAVDEGGVSKEFYQLITQQLFCPDYGMFVANEKTGLYWFNSQCSFCDDEYGLIGLLFGLAIYNNVLVDVRLPTALYTKLLARPAHFDELAELDPDLYKGLKALLLSTEDVESTYCYSFEISYKDAYGNTHHHELIPNGKNIPVSNASRKEFVALYSDFLLNGVVERQFDAFCAGFTRVASRGLLRRLCLPQQVEQLVCGVLDLNFDILAQSTRYQNGFTESSQTIKDLWTVAKAMSDEEKKMLLQFITGSDRAPVGGLAKLEIVIARNGDDKQRLPTAHTCYNVMLLPDYADLEVTRERLCKAISHSRGFGLQ